MDKSEFYLRVSDIQQELKAPKNQFNAFGKYKYRSCEDIVQGYKKLPYQILLLISDEVVLVGDRVYVKATATLTDGENLISCTGLAREAQTKKGMDDSQITGAASSYARKYALNGLFCIDDTKDADSMNNSANNKISVKLLSASQVKTIKGMLSELIPESVVCGVVNVNKIEEILESDFQACVNWIKGQS